MTANLIMNIVILIGLLLQEVQIRRLEENEKTLKEWIKFCYHVDLDKITEFVEKENRRR